MQAGIAKALTRDVFHMNPDGNQMMATGVLKVSGQDEKLTRKTKKSLAEHFNKP